MEHKKFYLKELPDTERPRERLLRKGAKSLTDYELLAIILRTGSSELSVLELSKYILINEGNIGSFNDITIEELKKYKGINVAKAVEILASVEFGKRVFQYQSEKIKIHSCKDIFDYVHIDMENLKVEVCKVVFLNVKGEVIISKEFQIGGSDHVTVDYHEIIKCAIKNSCKHIAIVHNHPSGDPNPSFHDRDFTKFIYSKLNDLGISVVDHVIIGKNSYYSFMNNKTVIVGSNMG